MHILEEFFVYQNGTDTRGSWSRVCRALCPCGGALAWERAPARAAPGRGRFPRGKRGLR